MNLLSESISMDKIPHFDMMNYSQIKRLFKTENWTSTQKMDGFNVSFGLSEGEIFIKPKTGKSFQSLKELEALNRRLPYFNTFKKFFEILEAANFKETYKKLSKDESLVFFGELLGSKRQNVVLYNEEEIGNGTIVLFGVKLDDGTAKGQDITLKESGQKYLSDICKYMVENDSSWNFKIAKPINFNLEKHHSKIKTIQKFIESNDIILITKKRDIKSKLNKKLKMSELQNLIISLKTNILEDLSAETPYLGANKLEGAVIRNSDTGAISKVVDREYFTMLNKSTWYGRTNASELSKKFVREVHTKILNSSDIIWESKIETVINGYLCNKKHTQFVTISELYKVLQDEYLQEHTLDESAHVALNNISKKFYDDITKLFAEVKSKQTTENKIDDDNYKRTVRHFISEINDLNSLVHNLSEFTYGKCVWFCLNEKLKAKIKSKYIMK
jgi:hypothetical protein